MRNNKSYSLPPSIPTCRTQHCQFLDLTPLCLSLVPTRKEKLEQVSKQLQGHILKSKSRTMEQLQDKRLVVQPFQWCYIRMAKAPIRSLHQFSQLVGRDFFR